ncbi:MAG: asparagine synthase C-terminal domain-containing protein, partial [Candidatus Gribaldobacteria bacterium]|nr:asparagine synthase C-terminal domain-containing protein [Candidatus Gribaldobacteria bacterium]
ARYAKEIAKYLGTNHTEMDCTQKEALEIVPSLPEIYDEPFGDSSAVPTFLISKLAHSQVKVVLSGDGGDEFFTGYDKYWNVKMLQALRLSAKMPDILGSLVDKVLSFSLNDGAYRVRKFSQMAQHQNIFERLADVATGFLSTEIAQMVKAKKRSFIEDIFRETQKDLLKLDSVSLWMYFDAKTYLPEDILTKVDRASMYNALEAREPLLDHKILEFVAQLPVSWKCDQTSGKYLLKEILRKYLPQKYWDRPKHGFSIPMRKWLLQDLRPIVEESLSEKALNEVGLLDTEKVLKVKKYFYENKNSNPYRIWYLLVFQMWAKRWLS